MKKKIIGLLVSLALIASLIPCAFGYTHEDAYQATVLHDMGLLQGSGMDASGNINYNLAAQPTRAEAVTMLVRLLGKETEAKIGNWDIPFTDVPDWAKPYIGYAYANHYTNGISSTEFAPNQKVSSSQYITLVLRALGYESGTDFQWDKAWILSDKLQFTYGEYTQPDLPLSRGDMVSISYFSLYAPIKGTQQTLGQRLVEEDVISQGSYDKIESSDLLGRPLTYTNYDLTQYYCDFVQSMIGLSLWLDQMNNATTAEQKIECYNVMRYNCCTFAAISVKRIISAATQLGYSDIVESGHPIDTLLVSGVNYNYTDPSSTYEFYKNIITTIVGSGNEYGIDHPFEWAIRGHYDVFPEEYREYYDKLKSSLS